MQSQLNNEGEISVQSEYKIIRLNPYGKKYCQLFSQEHYESTLKMLKKYSPDCTVEKLRERDRKEYDNYLGRDIPVGISRIGGPVVDLPEDIEYPEGFCFTAQLNCKELKEYDKPGLLPQKGFMYFFVRNPGNEGVVLYTPKEAGELRRVIREHTDWFFFGLLIGSINSGIESMESRYTIEEGKRIWDYFAGAGITKVYGMYTNCQANEEEVISKLNELEEKNLVLLLQIGSDFLDEGTQCVYIEKKDLQELNFTRCIFEYSQS